VITHRELLSSRGLEKVWLFESSFWHGVFFGK
jgi:hypothetical protein